MKTSKVRSICRVLLLTGIVAVPTFVFGQGPTTADRVVAFDGNDNETEAELFFLRTALLGALIEAINPGELRNSILRKFMRQLAASPLQKTSFIEWRLWINEVERFGPDAFYEIAAEFPNPNLKVLVAAKKAGL